MRIARSTLGLVASILAGGCIALPAPPDDRSSAVGPRRGRASEGAADLRFGALDAGSTAELARACIPAPSVAGGERRDRGRDLLFVLDRSRSMRDRLDGETTRWTATRRVIEAVLDEAPESIAVGLERFPVDRAYACSTSADCPAGGRCGNRLCTDGRACDDDADCAGAGPCTAFPGACSGDATFRCAQPGQPCVGGEPLASLGRCVDDPRSTCDTTTSCEPDDYATPAIGPGEPRAAIRASLDVATFGEGTPTAAALTGAIAWGRERRRADPSRDVLVALVTDGAPDGCGATADDVAAVAEEGARADDGVTTLVVAVVGPAERDARRDLDRIAEAGGSGAAIVVDGTPGTVGGLAARLFGTPCVVPAPPPERATR